MMFNMRSAKLGCCCVHVLEQHAHIVYMIGSSLSCNHCDNVMILAEDNIWEAKYNLTDEREISSDTARF